MRFRSQDPEPFANKLLAMMRHEFGGHAVKTAAERLRKVSSRMKMDARVFPDLDALSRAALDELLRICRIPSRSAALRHRSFRRPYAGEALFALGAS